MAKKQDRMSSVDPSPSPTSQDAKEATSSTANPPATPELIEEVQAFLNQRAELLKKVTAEISATENRLAELKQTAAMLAGDGHGSPAVERKKKKPKAKATADESRQPAVTPAEPAE